MNKVTVEVDNSFNFEELIYFLERKGYTVANICNYPKAARIDWVFTILDNAKNLPKQSWWGRTFSRIGRRVVARFWTNGVLWKEGTFNKTNWLVEYCGTDYFDEVKTLSEEIADLLNVNILLSQREVDYESTVGDYGYYTMSP